MASHRSSPGYSFQVVGGTPHRPAAIGLRALLGLFLVALGTALTAFAVQRQLDRPFGPVGTAPPLPSGRVPLTAANGTQVRLLDRWGRGTVRDVAWSPDGRRLAVASPLGFGLYDPESGREQVFRPTGAEVWLLCFSPDGGLLAAGMADGTVRLFRASDGAFLRTLPGWDGGIGALAFSPDGRLLAAGSATGKVRVWRLEAGGRAAALLWEDRFDPIRLDPPPQFQAKVALAFSPDGRTLAAGWVGEIRLYRPADGAVAGVLQGDRTWDGWDGFWSLAFSPDGRTLAAGTRAGEVWIYRLPEGERLRVLEGVESGGGLFLDGPKGTVWSLAFSPDGRTLAVGLGRLRRLVELWDGATGRRRQVLRVAPGRLLPRFSPPYGDPPRKVALAFSPDGRFLAVGGEGGAVRVWDLVRQVPLAPLDGYGDRIISLALAPDGRTLAVGEEGGGVRLWEEGRVRHFFPFTAVEEASWGRLREQTLIWSLAFSPDGRTLAVGTSGWRDPAALFRRQGDGGWRRLWTPFLSGPTLAFSPDGRTLVATPDKGVLEFRRLDRPWWRGRRIRSGPFWIDSLAFSPDGSLLAVGYGTGGIELLRLPEGTSLGAVAVLAHSVPSLAFSPDGRLLAAGKLKGPAVVLEAGVWQVRDRLEGAAGWEAWAVAFSPDGSLLATGTRGGLVALWRVEDGSLLAQRAAHRGGVTGLAFSADGTLLVTAGLDGTVAFWGVPAP